MVLEMLPYLKTSDNGSKIIILLFVCFDSGPVTDIVDHIAIPHCEKIFIVYQKIYSFLIYLLRCNLLCRTRLFVGLLAACAGGAEYTWGIDSKSVTSFLIIGSKQTKIYVGGLRLT